MTSYWCSVVTRVGSVKYDFLLVFCSDPGWLSEVADNIVHGADDLVQFVGSYDAVAVDVVQLERPLQFDRSVPPLLHGLRLTAGTSTPVRSIGPAAFARLTVDSWNVHSSFSSSVPRSSSDRPITNSWRQPNNKLMQSSSSLTRSRLGP